MGSAVESANWCHQCKVRKLVVQCTSLHPRCPKRYCDQCLCSHYGESLEGTVGLADWACPFCRGLCVCAACKRRALGAAHSSLAAAQPPSQQPAAVSAPPGAPLGAGAAGALSEGAAHGGQPAPMARAGCCGAQVAPGGNLQLWCGSTPGSDAATVAAAAAALGRPPGGAASAVRPAAGALAQSQAVTIAFQPPPLPPPPPREPSARMPYKCSKCGLPKVRAPERAARRLRGAIARPPSRRPRSRRPHGPPGARACRRAQQGHVCLGSPQPPPPGAPVAATTPAPPAQAPLLLQAQLQHHTALSRPTPQQPLALPTDALRAAIHATGSAFSAGMGAEELSALLADARPGQRELPRAGAGGAALASLCAQLAQGPAALPQPQQPPLQPIAQRPAPPQPGAPGKGAPGEAEGAGLGSNGCGGAGAASLHGDVPVRNAEASADDESASKRLRARIEM